MECLKVYACVCVSYVVRGYVLLPMQLKCRESGALGLAPLPWLLCSLLGWIGTCIYMPFVHACMCACVCVLAHQRERSV
jgi:hypothetical protein